MKKLYYGMANYNSKEINASLNVLKQSLSLMDGKNVHKLEKNCKIIWKKYLWLILVLLQSLQFNHFN